MYRAHELAITHSRRRFLTVVFGGALAGCAGGRDTPTDEGDASATTGVTGTPGPGSAGLTLSTPAFDDGGAIPATYTADGSDRSPPFEVQSVPDEAETLALVVDDPDAPGGTFVHWLLWNVPASVTSVPAGLPQRERLPDLGGARQGANDFGELGYRGPKPPRSDGPHTYRFTLHAADATLSVAAGATRDRLEGPLAARSIATARLTGEYERN